MNRLKPGARQWAALLVLATLAQLQLAPGEPDTPPTGSQKKSAKTGHEWSEHFKCKLPANETAQTGFRFPLSNLWFHLMSDCHREELSWRFKYVEELKPSFRHYIQDATVDERLANLVYTTSQSNMFDTNYYTFNSGDRQTDAENELRVAGSRVDNARCPRDLLAMYDLYDDMQDRLRQLRNGANPSLNESHIRLARVLDSFGRYESGSLDGKLLLAGSHKECTGSQLPLDGSPQNVQMRYCWANMNIKKRLHPLLKGRQKFSHEAENPVLNTAVCLPESCHSMSFHSQATRRVLQKLINSQLRLPESIYVDGTLDFESVFCLVDEDSDYARLPRSGKLCLAFVGAWVVLCVGATVANKALQPEEPASHSMEKSAKQTASLATYSRPAGQSFPLRLCNHLDLAKSWREFVSDKRQPEPADLVDLDTLNPVKLFACAFCVVAHTTLILASLAFEPIQIAAYVDTSVLLLAAVMTSVVIDTFFVISGILTTYISLKKVARHMRRRSIMLQFERQNSMALAGAQQAPAGAHRWHTLADETRAFAGQWLMVSLNRYLRIVPFYALLFWFRRDVLNYLGEGPLWDHGLNRDTASGACMQEPWYTPFTFITAFKQLSKQCFVPSWSISNDIFFGLFMPPLALGFLHRPRLAIWATVAITLASVLAAMDAVTTSNMPDVWQYLDANIHGIVLVFRSLTPLYSWPIYRACAFLVGALAGYLLFDYERRHTVDPDRSGNSKTDSSSGAVGETGLVSAAPAGPPSWPRWLAGPATAFAWVYILWHLLLSIFANDLKAPLWPYHRLFAFYFLNVDRLVWSISNAVIFLQMTTTWRRSALMESFASQRWRTLAKLNFPMIFVHWLLIVLYIGHLPAAPAFSLWHIFSAFSVIMVASLAVSTLLHVIFENPVDKLVKRELFGA